MSPHSLSTDAVDKYNYKWMVMLLLLLSLVAFIIPLHPSYQNQTGESTSTTTTPPPTKTSKSPEIDIACWCPAHFTLASISYTHTYCKNALLAALRGQNTTSVSEVSTEDVVPIEPGGRKPIPITTSRKEYFDKKRQGDERDEKREDIKGRVQMLVTFQAPIMLLLAAILMTLPHVIWSFLSACCGSFNVEQTLESAGTNRHVIEEIYASIAAAVRTCPNTLSILYLVKKIMSVVVVLVLLIVMCQYVLPKVEELDKEIDSIDNQPSDSKLDKDFDVTTSNNGGSDPKSTAGHYNDLFKFPKDVISCEFEVRRLTNVQQYSIQCVVREGDEEKDEPQTTETIISSRTKSSRKERNLLELESLLFKIATAVLAILTVGNVFSLCAWVCKLLTHSSRDSIGLSRNTALDVVLLVQLARVNTSVEVIRRLTQSSSTYEPVDSKE